MTTSAGDPTHHVHVEGSNVSSSREGEIDEEGYLIDQHHETEQFSHTREVRELDDHTEIMQHDSRCLQLEELKTKETVRLATAEELRALLEASVFDGKDEIEIGTEITVEGFVRVEQTHEETAAGGSTNRSVTVTETREKEEINETPTKAFDKTLRLEGNAPSDLQCQMQMEDLMRNNNAIENNGTVRNDESNVEAPQDVNLTRIPDAPQIEKVTNNVVSSQPTNESGEVEKEVTRDAETVGPDGQSAETKNFGLIGFIKERSRSLSRNRSDGLIKEEGGEKKKEKKKWSFGLKSKKNGKTECLKGKSLDAAESEGVDDNKLQSSTENVKKEKKLKKRGLFGKHKENSCIGSPKEKSIPNEDGNEEKSDQRNTPNDGDPGADRSWSLFRKKSDKKKDSVETSLENGKREATEGSADHNLDSNRKHSTNSLQRGIRNLFSNKKESNDQNGEESFRAVGQLSSGPTTPLSNHDVENGTKLAQITERRRSETFVPAVFAGCSAVIAVDLGPISCGYAYNFTQQKEGHAADTIYTMKKPEGSDPGIIDPRFPTSLLINPEGNLHAFGSSARYVYHSLEPTEALRWMYFDDFREELANISTGGSDSTVKASNGEAVSTRRLLHLALQFLSYEALRDIAGHLSDEPLGRVRWVITLPPSLGSEARKWVREVAYEVGLGSVDFPEQLIILAQSHSEAVYVHRQQFLKQPQCGEQQLLTAEGQKSAVLQPTVAVSNDSGHSPTISLLVHCGGDVATISIYEIGDVQAKLMYQLRTPNSGATRVNEEFSLLVEDIFGRDFLRDFKEKRSAGWLDLILSFEALKRSYNPAKETPLTLPLPFSFIDHHKKYFGFEVEDSITKRGRTDVYWTQQGMLRLQIEAWTKLFLPTISVIKESIQTAIHDSSAHRIKYLCLIGGFADNFLLQREIQETFKQFEFVTVNEPGQVHVRGAVYYGMDPALILHSQ